MRQTVYKKTRSKRGRQRIVGQGRQGQIRQTGRRGKDTELETTIQPQTRERLTQYIGGNTGVGHQTNETRGAEGR